MNILITGASSGIGKRLKELYEESGNNVLNISRNKLDEKTFEADITNYKKIDEVFEIIKNKYKKIDILVNCAGYGLSGISEHIPVEEVEKIMTTNFTAAFYMIKKTIPLMQNGGKIVNINSMSTLFPVPFRAFYSASKAALLAFSDALRVEVEPLGIEVTSICPGDIKSAFTANRKKLEGVTDPRYLGNDIKLNKKVDSREEKRMPLEYAVKKIKKVIDKRHYKPMYIVGNKYKVLYFVSKCFPKSLVEHAKKSYFK